MKFGEKVKELRIAKNLSQTELAQQVGVSMRTVRGWEVEGRYPKQQSLYVKLADALGCDISYLMSNEESFVTEASELYGARGAKQAQQILEQTAALFAGGVLSEEDQLEFITEIQSLYLDSKKRAKKFTAKKSLTGSSDAAE
jgi:transcriptional regulator with XRE-family HTH domain